MKTRIISGLCMCPLLILIWLGGYFLFALCLVALAFSSYEFLKAYASSETRKKVMLFYLPLILIAFCAIIFIDDSGFYHKYTVLLIFIIAFLTDIFAYFTGMLFGKHKLAPKISPKKTVEGLIGGIVFSGIGTFLFFLLVYDYIISAALIRGLVIGVIGGLIAQLGDLTASLIKRKLDIKDFSNLIPGHGGVLDRIDGVLFVAIYLSIVLLFVK